MPEENLKNAKTPEGAEGKVDEKKETEASKNDEKGGDPLTKILESLNGFSGRLEALEGRGKTTDAKTPQQNEQDALKESIRREIFIDEMSSDFKDYLKGKKIDLERSSYESLKALKEIYKELKEVKEAKEEQKKNEKETPNPGKTTRNESEQKRMEEIKKQFTLY